MKYHHRSILLYLALILLASLAYTIDASASDEADKQFGFAESLLQSGDYYRAISEFRRFIYYYPADNRMEKAFYLISDSYYRAKRWVDALDSINEFIKRYPEGSFIKDALMLKGNAEMHLKRFDESLSTFRKLTEIDNGEFRNKALYQSALIFIEKEQWAAAQETFKKIPRGSSLYGSSSGFASGLSEINRLPLKSPALAGSLAAVIPGAGHLYTERPRDAAVAFLLNATFIVAAVELFRHDNYAAGGIVAFFELGWYAGNIYSAVNSAHKFNKRIREDFIRSLKDRSSLSFDVDPVRRKLCVMYNLSY